MNLGEASFEYDPEDPEEEWLLVLDGEVEVRRPDGSERLGPQRLAFFLIGPDGADAVDYYEGE